MTGSNSRHARTRPPNSAQNAGRILAATFHQISTAYARHFMASDKTANELIVFIAIFDVSTFTLTGC